ncbi:MAG: M50 family metallopeptidase, partial [Woeseiaceae bacterium]
MTWVYVIVGILCLIALQSLRSVLSIVFPVRHVRPGTRPDARQYGGLELIDETTAALKYLGFEGPAWLCDEERQSDIEHVSHHAVFRNVEKSTVAWVGPTIDISQPDQQLFYYTTALNDGRFAVTQVSDPYFSAVDDPQTPAQTIPATDKASELQQHLGFVESLDSSPIAKVPIRDAVMRFAGEHMNSIRERLIERGKIRVSDGIARPGFVFALRLLRKIVTRPVRPATKASGIPTARLAFLARIVQRTSERAPAQSTQWLLLILSAVLFVAIGWPILGLNYTAIILGVILFHEGGHWAAMKAFGYRNPHITLLPLLGGVTIGHETDPGAAKRVWVSLAGPLPGIILGWLLVYTVSVQLDASLYSEWLLPTILVMLFVNYLNVLPIPPLDGAHVVKALLPPRWVFIQIIAVFLGVVIGVYVAYLLSFWPLAFIAALQLFAVKNLWTDAKLVRYFDRERPPETDEQSVRTEWVLTKLDTLLGAPRQAAKRIALAQSILSQIDMRPMGALHRSVASLIYLSLVAVPVAALGLTATNPFLYQMSPEAIAIYDELDAEQARFVEESKAMSLEEIVQELNAGIKEPRPVTTDEIKQLEMRMGISLPDLLRDFYLQTNGLPMAGLLPIAEVRPIDPDLLTDGELQYHVYEGRLSFYDHAYNELVVPVAETANWWQIGYSEEWL